MSISKKLYLVTGFLGAGKTTLMKELINVFHNQRIAIIVNEFGKQGIDGALLTSDGIEVNEINNGSIFCVCRSDLFVDALIKALKLDIDILLIETSGLSDPTGMKDILQIVTKLSGEIYDFKGTISVVDATNFLKLIHTAVAVPQQIASSHLILINKTDLVDEQKLQEVESTIKGMNPAAILKRTTFSIIDDIDLLEKLNTSIKENAGSILKKRPVGLQKLLVKLDKQYPLESVKKWIDEFNKIIYRIKGFVELSEGWYYVDGTGENVSITAVKTKQNESFLVVLASGDKPVKRMIEQGWSKYFSDQLSIT